VRRAAAASTLVVALALASCSSGAGVPETSSTPTGATPSASRPRPTPTAPSPTATPVDSATPDPSTSTSTSTSPSVAPAPLTDYGALLAVWAVHHAPDERFDPGAMWDPSPGWGPNDANDDKFNNTVVTGGRVLSYDMYLPRPSVAAAKAIALATATVPRDATVVWRQQFPSCYVVQLRSAALGTVLAAKSYANPQGQVQLLLRSGSPLGAAGPFDPTKVTTVLVRPTVAADAAGFAGC